MSYYQKNRERILAYQKEYNRQHSDEIKSYFKSYYEENKDVLLNKAYIKNAVISQANKEKKQKQKEERALIKQKKKQEQKQQELEDLIASTFEVKKVLIKEELKLEMEPFQGFKRTSQGFTLSFD
jgi:hypothetical protein